MNDKEDKLMSEMIYDALEEAMYYLGYSVEEFEKLNTEINDNEDKEG